MSYSIVELLNGDKIPNKQENQQEEYRSYDRGISTDGRVETRGYSSIVQYNTVRPAGYRTCDLHAYITLFVNAMSLSNHTNLHKFYTQLSTIYRNKRLLGLDVGDRYVGLAVDDITHTSATPLYAFQRKQSINNKLHPVSIQSITQQLYNISNRYNICAFIVGIPLSHKYRLNNNTDTITNNQSIKTINFVNTIKLQLLQQYQYQPVIYYHNEQYTTHIAQEYMYEAGVRNSIKRDKNIDKLSASIILQDYIDIMHAVNNTHKTYD